MKSLLYILILLLTACSLSAQQTIKGIVTDAENGQPVDAATVQIRKAGRQVPLTYTLTKADGTFILPLRQADDSLFVHVSLLGYKAIRQKITAGATLRIRLEPEVFTLKEVEIRPGRVYGRQDTINYDVSQFISPKDEAIKDVLKKLPGVDVDDDGKISYNGKNISKFYVEGMDLTDGRYNQLTNNLQANAVKSVQVMENHQHPCPAKEADNRRYRHQPQTERRLPRPLDGHVRRRHGRFPPFVGRHGQCHPDQP